MKSDGRSPRGERIRQPSPRDSLEYCERPSSPNRNVGSQRKVSPRREISPRRASPYNRSYSPRGNQLSPSRERNSTQRRDLSPFQRFSPRRDHEYNSRHSRSSPGRHDKYAPSYTLDKPPPLSPTYDRRPSDSRSTFSPHFGDISASKRQDLPLSGYSPRGKSPRAYDSSLRDRRHSPSRGGYGISRPISPTPRSPRRVSPNQRSPIRYRSPGRYSPPRRQDSPSRYHSRRISPNRRVSSHSRHSPYRHRSPRGLSPRRRSPDHFKRSPEPYKSRSPFTDARSPRGERLHGQYKSPRPEMRPDSTIPDADLHLPTQTSHSIASHFISNLKHHSDSPKRVSLDERLEMELGVPRDAAPPPPASASLQVKAATLPTSIPTYDDIPGVKQQQSSVQAVAPEKEQAMAAAQMVTSKLMEMQAAKEAERARKREARLAERMAAAAQVTDGNMKAEVGGMERIAAAATGRILEQVEAQEMASETEQQKLKKRNRGDGPGTPTLITLKPRDRKPKKRKVETPIEEEEDWPEYSDAPRSPVPIPDNSVCKSVLVKFGFGVSKESGKKKSVKYRDGVAPGAGSPTHSSGGNHADGQEKNGKQTTEKKKFKKIKVVFVTQKRSDEPPPPPPPMGSPPRYHTSDLITKFAEAGLLETKA